MKESKSHIVIWGKNEKRYQMGSRMANQMAGRSQRAQQ